jgi:hypothetical protein
MGTADPPSEVSRRVGPAGTIGIGILVLLLLSGAAPAVPSHSAPPRPTDGVVQGLPGIGFLILNTTSTWHVPSDFLGINVGPYSTVSKTLTNYLNQTRLHMVRWPGGAIGDGFNYTTNQITRPDGSTYTPPWNTSQFIDWCRNVSCRANFELPGEINDSATAAYFVRYVERSLGFHPFLWEIGNEPALWHQFNIPWSHWGSPKTPRITPMQYAQLVHRYVTAIHAVDPKAHILGLPGVGTGAYRENAWIHDTVKLNRHTISGVGIHVYPAGHALDQNGTVAQFYRTLLGTGSLPSRIPLDQAAIALACPKCHHIPIYATEVGSATNLGGSIPGTVSTAMSGFRQVPFIAAEVVQGMSEQVRGLEFFCLQSNYPGALFNTSSNSFRPVADLFSTVLPHVNGAVLPIQLIGAAPGLYVLASRNANGSSYSILVANTNMSQNATLPLNLTGVLTSGYGEIWNWTMSMNGPSTALWSGWTPDTFFVPKDSVVLVKIATQPGLL